MVADRELFAMAVKVKPLIWPKACEKGLRVHSSGLLPYTISNSGIYRWARAGGEWSWGFDSYEEAKASAQENYAKRILSALEPE
jgi:hypothetical protein